MPIASADGRRRIVRPIWMTRVVRVFKPPKCAACGYSTEGGLYCDVCGQKLIERTRDSLMAQTGPRSV
jgi:hypothetical protein